MKNLFKLPMLTTFASLAFSQWSFASQTNTCTDATGIEHKTIAEIQGSSAISPLLSEGVYETEQEYMVTGIVSAHLYNAITLYNQDGDDTTSDGLYVYMGNTSLPSVGHTVCVRGIVKEYFGLTQISATNKEWELVDNTTTSPGAIDLKVTDENGSFAELLERHEGMLVNLPSDMNDSQAGYQDMRVARTYSYDYDARRNNMALTYSRINLHPNQVAAPGSAESIAQRAQNQDYLLFLESDDRASNGEIPYYPGFQSNPNTNYIRVNDSVVDLKGVILYNYDRYRLYVPDSSEFNVTSSNFIRNTPRSDTPIISTVSDYDEFIIKVATQNVLNYFNSPFGGEQNPHGDDRGADSSDEFTRQTEKLINTLYAMDSDVVGLLEVENNGFGTFSAIKKIQDELNNEYYKEFPRDRGDARHQDNRYAFVGFDANGDTIIDEQDTIGSDVVTTGILYRPSKLTLEAVDVIPMPSQHAPIIVDETGAAILDGKGEIRESGDNYQRDSLMATFIVHSTGKRLTVVANHLKSKGSTCWEDWQGWETWENFDPTNDNVQDLDFQGNCEHFRVAAAVQLGEQMEKIGGDRILLGDMNAYTYEDPILVLTKNPTDKAIYAARDTFIKGIKQFGSSGKKITKTYGYISAAALKDDEKGKLSWSYSYNDEVGSLDHMLISPSLEDRLVDAVEWHINAAESTLYDYNEEFKGSNANAFYEVSPFRSSDHDSAVMSLSYRYGETDGKRVTFASSGDSITVPFSIPATATPEVNDVAKLKIRGLNKNSNTVAIPEIKLTENGQQTVFFEVVNLDEGQYTLEMSLVKGAPEDPDAESREGTVVSDAKQSMEISVKKRSGLIAESITPPYDHTGGGGPLGPMLLVGLLGLLRLKRKS